MSPIFTAAPRRHPTWALGTFAEPLASGEAGTAQTIAHMRQLVDEALHDPSIIRLAKDIVRNVAPFDDAAEAQAIYNWVATHIRFTKDPVNKELLIPPAELLKVGAGDCDEVSMLTATLAMAIGYPARLVTVAANATAPDQFSHVYVEAEVPAGSGQWIAMDPARPDSMFGFEPPIYSRKRAWSLTDDSYQDLSGTKIYARGNVVVRLSGLEQSLQTPAPTLGNYPRYRGLGTGLGTYQSTPHFAYPGWRRRIPGGPAGGQYHGWTHNYSVGTALEAQDQFEADRNAGAAGHDPAHASPRSPRGVYRGPAEVPPAPNAGTRGYRTYRGFQEERHPGTSIAPGSFPAPFVEEILEPLLLGYAGPGIDPRMACEMAAPPEGMHYEPDPNPSNPCGMHLVPDGAVGTDGTIPSDGSGATNLVNDSGPPMPSDRPGPSVPVDTLPVHITVPISPQPGPRVGVKDFVADWQGGTRDSLQLPGWHIERRPDGTITWGTGTPGQQSTFAGWMDQDSIVAGVANKWILGGGLLLFAFMGRKK